MNKVRLEQGKIMQSGTPAEIFLQQRLTGKFNLRAQILAIRHEEVVHVMSLLLGNDIVEVIATDDEIAGLNVGDIVSVSAKAFSPMILR